jgi:hypothetical protein
MPANFQFFQTYGTSPGTDYALGTGLGTYDWDFKSVDTPGLIDPANATTQCIVAGDFSMVTYLRGKFSQPTSGPPFSSITNVRFYASTLTLTGLGTDAYILASGGPTYNTPTKNSISGLSGWISVPTTSGSGLDIGTTILSGSAGGWTNWVGLQLRTFYTGSVAGYGSNEFAFTVTYDEI